ncbi:unnamed protein product [Adineta steineri]|uniref:Uncharacterized protein n=1 Tax=Adineta steineri TaxID=433720 RepID=A0A815NUW3_9BILA|nr:unnamed protein product [Adineta steineri]CAF1632023.1 unnamed protein product [Adineta steineri]
MQNKIDKLELENSFVTNYLRDISTRDILSQLNDAVKSDENLIIEYTFTRPLEKFQSKLFNAIKETNSRLIFKIRSAEATSSLELTGTNEGGFILSIKSDDETNALKYFSAINSIFKELKISTLHLHKAILSENLCNTIHLANINCETSLKQLAETINQLPLLKTLELQSETSCAVFHREKRIFNRESSILESDCISPKYYHSSQEESSNPPPQISNEREDRRAMLVEPFSHTSSNPLYKQIQEIAFNFTPKQFQITVSPDVSITHIASIRESNSLVTHLQFAGRIEETDMTTLIKAFRKNKIISHLSLKEIEISLLNLRQIFDMSYANRRLRVLEIRHCTSVSDREVISTRN